MHKPGPLELHLRLEVLTGGDSAVKPKRVGSTQTLTTDIIQITFILKY